MDDGRSCTGKAPTPDPPGGALLFSKAARSTGAAFLSRRIRRNLTRINDKIIHRYHARVVPGKGKLMSDKDYFLRRAAAEVDAAHRATNGEAKRAHLELAELYLLRIENGSSVLGSPSPASEDRLSA